MHRNALWSQRCMGKKGGNGQKPAHRPRDARLGRATGLIDLLAVMAELNIEKIDGIPEAEMPPSLLQLVQSLSDKARETGKLTLGDALLILAYQFKGTVSYVENFVRAAKRARVRWNAEDGPPFSTAPDPKQICTCKHRHCSGPCSTWANPPLPCGRLIADGKDWTLPAPCRPGTTVCNCRHVHCEGCGIGAPEHHPMIQPAYSCRIVPNQLELERSWFGWFCPECMPAQFKSVPLPESPARELSFPGCPKCGGDVAIDGETYRCVGLDAEIHRSLYAAELLNDQHVKLMIPTGFVGPEEQRAFKEHWRELLRTLPEKIDPRKPCGRAGSVEYLVEQRWRSMLPKTTK